MKNVNVHYEGGWLFEVEANSEEDAEQKGEEMFNEIDDRELVANLADIKIDSVWESYETYNPITGEVVDTFDYDKAGLFSPDDCDGDNPPRLCYGCKFEHECCNY